MTERAEGAEIDDARFERAVDKRSGAKDRLVVYVDRKLKTCKRDAIELTPEHARHIAMRLLMAAEQAEGKRVSPW